LLVDPARLLERRFRPRAQSLVTDSIHAWVGRDAARGVGAPISLFLLTDDEILLRDMPIS
jgi:hypothetical protein